MSNAHSAIQPVILVVDDDQDARFIYSLYLRSRGCRIHTADRCHAAMTKATALSPDLIVIDLAKPGAGGWATIRQLVQSPSTGHIPIVALSVNPEASTGAVASGCHAFLPKPCEPERLWSLVQVLLKLPQEEEAPDAAPIRMSSTSL